MQAIKDARVESEKDDKMAALENKTKDSKMEMEILDGVAIVRIALGKAAWRWRSST